MTPERYQQIGELYHAALELEPEHRDAFLDQACAGDEALRREVDSLLISHQQADDFISVPALEVAAGLLAKRQFKTLIGEQLGPYKVQALLGTGGMGEVYLAQDTRLGRRVALKLLPSHFIRDEERLRRFQQEARTASMLNHPNILTVHEIDEMADMRYIVTEFIEGKTLRERITDAHLTLAEVIDIAAQVASALAAAHAAGIIHRDIKPENIMLRHDGYVKVLDFGLAKLTEQHAGRQTFHPAALAGVPVETNPGLVMGTPYYMSPEQARGINVDGRTDMWSLGVLLYEMLTGQMPFEGATASDCIVSIIEKEPLPLVHHSPEIPDELQRIVSKALRKNPEQRYPTINELLVELRSLKSGLDSGVIPAIRSTGDVRAARPTSSAEYLVSRIKRHRRGAVVAALVAPLIAIAMLVYFNRSDKPAIRSLAILPFLNVGADPETEHLSDGITENLINNLAQLPTLRVIARSTVFSYKGQAVDSQKVGRDLGVDAIVMGKVEQHGDILVIQADLVDVATGAQLWGERFNLKPSDILMAQEEIARSISEKLRVRVTDEERSRATKRYTNNVAAYQEYLKGRYHWNKRTEEGLKKGIDYFNRALDLDPTYALAYVGLADSYNMFARFTMLPPHEAYPKARAAAEKALEIDETLAEAHTALAIVKMDYDWDLPAAEREFTRAIKLNPGYPEAHQWYGLLLAAHDQIDEAIREMKRAQELDPLSLIIDLGVGGIYIYAHRYDQAIEHFQKTSEFHPEAFQPYVNLAYIYEIKEMHDEAVAAHLKSRTLAGESPERVSALKEAYALSGWRGYLQMRLDEMKKRSTQKYVPPFSVALLCALLGQKDEAFAWLEKAYEERSYRLLFIKIDPRLDGLRSDSRFTDLVRRVGPTQ